MIQAEKQDKPHLPYDVKVPPSGSSSNAGGATIRCAHPRRCNAFYAGSGCTNTRGARKEARSLGWLTDQPGGVHLGANRWARLDYCPEHAAANRDRY